MSRLALTRLVTAGNRSSGFRLAGITAGVMVGVALFLLLYSASQAFGERSLRSSWSELVSENPIYLESTDVHLAPDEAAVTSMSDHFGDDVIRVVKIATPDDSTIQVPGLEQVPKPGQYVASPALAELIASVPADELGDRYGTVIGSISADALEGPDSLVIVVGASLDQVATSGSLSGAQIVTQFTGYDYSSQAYRTVAIIGAIAVLIPVLLLIAIVTDLGAAQRAERFATLRLIGATPQQVARMAGLEIAVTTLIGSVLGIGLYLAIIPLAARLEIGTSRFYPSDLLTSPTTMVTVAVVTVLGATAVAWWRTRRAGIGPLSATRERQERAPRVISLLPLLMGITSLTAGVVIDLGASLNGLVLIVGFILAIVGLLLAGPLLTRWVARTSVARAGSAAQVIGYNRIMRHPRASFRAVAGLVVAVYTVTVFAVAITAAAGSSSTKKGDGHLPTTTLYTLVDTADDTALHNAIAGINDTPGVTTVALAEPQPDSRLVMTEQDAVALGAPEIDSDSGYVAVSPDWLVNGPASPQPVDDNHGLETGSVMLLVATDGTADAVERARTTITGSGLSITISPTTRADNTAMSALAMENQFAALAYTGILIAVALSTVSLAVSTLAALISRQRVFGLLKLTGMPIRTLRSIITYETVTPVATVFLASIALGAFSAWAIITGISSRTLAWPDPTYYVILAVCAILIGLAIVVTTRSAMRLLRTNTTRFE